MQLKSNLEEKRRFRRGCEWPDGLVTGTSTAVKDAFRRWRSWRGADAESTVVTKWKPVEASRPQSSTHDRTGAGRCVSPSPRTRDWVRSGRTDGSCKQFRGCTKGIGNRL